MKRLRKHTKGIIENLVINLNDFRNSQEPETLHQIRVEIKKIKAILNAISFSETKFKAHKTYLPFRNIFRKAGAIREPGVLQKLLAVAPTSAKVKKSSSQKKDSMATFVKGLPLFIESVLRQWKKIKPFVANVHRKELKVYLRKLSQRARDELAPKPNMRVIHKTRKAIKEILYLSKITGSISKKARSFYSGMEEATGQWHDKQTLLNNISKLNGKAGHKNKLTQLKTACLKDQEKITQLAGAYY